MMYHRHSRPKYSINCVVGCLLIFLCVIFLWTFFSCQMTGNFGCFIPPEVLHPKLFLEHHSITCTEGNYAEIRPKSKYSNLKSPMTIKAKSFKILFWTSFFGVDDFWFGIGHRPFVKGRCKFQTCETTNDINELNSSDVIIIHVRDIKNQTDLPPYRFNHQRWVFLLTEPPPNLYIDPVDYNGLFNLTMTYRHDSDIRYTYGRLKAREQCDSTFVTSHTYATVKKELVAWFVSNCNDKESGRTRYVREMQKYIPVHIFGQCGPLKCQKDNQSYCDKMLNERYKFYLSLENSICKDYITEKVWKILELNIIPIVLGGGDYAKHLPPHSYIDVKDFPSPKALTDYLYLLDKNDNLYNAYFQWKRDLGLSLTPNADAFCDLCEYMHTNEKKVSVYNRLDLWWNKDADCQTPKEFYKGVADDIDFIDN